MPSKKRLAQLRQLRPEEWNRYVVNPASERREIKQLIYPDESSSGAEVAPEVKHWLEAYSPSTFKYRSYYRYVWMEGRKLHHRHLPGGNVESPRVIALKQRVESAIAAGLMPCEIEQLIKPCDPS